MSSGNLVGSVNPVYTQKNAGDGPSTPIACVQLNVVSVLRVDDVSLGRRQETKSHVGLCDSPA